jgi:serine/threonine protein phosphatase PrpC
MRSVLLSQLHRHRVLQTATRSETQPRNATLSAIVPLFLLQRAFFSGAAAAPSGKALGVLQFESAARVIPHPAKAARGGEDSFFSHPFAIGVSDGVGGWNEVGVTSEYSRVLVASSLAAVEKAAPSRDPVELMFAGYLNAKGIRSSATYCIVSLDATSDELRKADKHSDAVIGQLRTANLGDSGFMLYRRNALVFRSKEQQHGFNFPFQLGHNSEDTPNSADVFNFPVESEDLVIVGSDGLFDNVHDANITRLVQKHQNIYDLADRLSRIASKHANDQTYRSPFAERRGRTGGKLDDITVVVARIRTGAAPQRMAGATSPTAGSAVTGEDGKLLQHTLAATPLLALVVKSAETVVERYTRLAEKGDVLAMNNLGLCFEHGNGVEKSAEKAVEWFTRAAEKGDVSAMINLGLCFQSCDGAVKSAEKAVEWFMRAIEKGDALAMFNLGLCFEKGDGVEKSAEKATEWFMRAAEKGDVSGMLNLGLSYMGGYGIEKSAEKAAEWWHRAAEKGEARAMDCLALCYRRGDGVEKSHEKAVEWTDRAKTCRWSMFTPKEGKTAALR